MKKAALILYTLLILAALGLLGYQFFIQNDRDPGNYLKPALVLIGIGVSIGKVLSGKGKTRRTRNYRQVYGHIIGTAFSDDRKLEKKFYKALNDFNKGKYTESLKKLDALRMNCSGSADRFPILVFSALCQSRTGNYEEAIRLYTNALQIREHSTVASNMGNCYLELGKIRDAAECFQRALRSDSSNPNAYNNLAQLYIQAGEFEQALPYAQQAVEINGTFPEALSAVAICHAMLGNEAEYERFFRRAVSCGYDGNTLRRYIQILRSAQ